MPGAKYLSIWRACFLLFCLASATYSMARHCCKRTSKTATSLPGSSWQAPLRNCRKRGSLRATGSSTVSSKATTSAAKGASGPCFLAACSAWGRNHGASTRLKRAKSSSSGWVPSPSKRS